MSMYPERRPYATTVTHSGYRAKPQPLSPRPPTEALKMLTSYDGYDAPRCSSARPRTTGGRLPTIKGTDPANISSLHPALFPECNRSPNEALNNAKLEDPFQHDTTSYHTSQQPALNAELRAKVERFMAEWCRKVQQLKALTDTYPSECAITNYSSTEALKTYFDVYRCTEDLKVPLDQLIEDFHLGTSIVDIEEIEATPVIPLDNIRRSLDSLLNSHYLLAPLDQYASSLEVFDYIAKEQQAKEEEPVEMDEDGNLIGPVCPSTTAVTLHERFHYNPGEYSEKELKKSEDPLLDMEDRVHTAKRRKEEAIDEVNPGEALRQLHAQVDFSNDLLLMNKARMLLVAMHSDDMREMRIDVLRVINDAKRAAETLQRRVASLLPKITQDIGTLREGADESRNTLEAMRVKEREAEVAMRESMHEVDAKEKELWAQLQDVMTKLLASANEKQKAAQQRMSMREQRAKEYLATQELLKAQERQISRLSECEGTLTRWDQGSDVYNKYVEAFVPKLLKRLNQLEEEDEDLNTREAQDYVRRYEMFVYGAEEARAKRVVQADRMRLLQRSSMLNQERALETLDPSTDVHSRKMEEAAKELEEVTAYVEYITSIEEDRRAEVEPVLQRVMAHNMNLHQAIDNGTAGEALALEDNTNADSVGCNTSASDEEAAAKAAEGGAMVAADGKVSTNSTMLATVAHPFVSARKIGLTHEESYTEKHRLLNDEELAAAEEKMGGVRRSKAELATMADRYKNADYIKSLLEI